MNETGRDGQLYGVDSAVYAPRRPGGLREVIAIAAASARSVRHFTLVRPRESARQLVTAARGVQRARMRRKYDAASEGEGPAPAVGLRSVSELRWPAAPAGGAPPDAGSASLPPRP